MTGELLKKGLDAALAIEGEGNRAWALTALAPQLTGELLKQGLDAALAIKDEGALESLAPQLTGELLKEGLDAALAIEDKRYRARYLVIFLPIMSDKTDLLKTIHRLMVDYLFTLQNKNRQDVLNFCSDKKLFAPPIFNQAILNAIADHIIEICWHWSWL